MKTESKGAFRYPEQEKKFPREDPFVLAMWIFFRTLSLFILAVVEAFNSNFQTLEEGSPFSFRRIAYLTRRYMEDPKPTGERAYRGRNDKRMIKGQIRDKTRCALRGDRLNFSAKDAYRRRKLQIIVVYFACERCIIYKFLDSDFSSDHFGVSRCDFSCLTKDISLDEERLAQTTSKS